MKTPVLIAAYNEESYIGPTLEQLPADQVEPLVVANGCTDETAEIARSFGATVIETDLRGKMPAIQTGLKFLGCRALGPVLLLDADSPPQFPELWPTAMTKPRLDEGVPEVVAGPIVLTGHHWLDNSIRTGRMFSRHCLNRAGLLANRAIGANMMLHAKTTEMLDAVLAMPHYWPGEDQALADLAARTGGRFTQSLNPRGAVLFNGRYLNPLTRRLQTPSKSARRAASLSHYVSRGAPGSMPYSG